MTKVITYGTFDLLHYGHVKLLERAKALGDYLIVGVTSDDYDISRGKINNQESLMKRIESVRNLGIADEIIVEEYEGQKIDDIKKYNVDVFTVGSDWKGKFDYLNEYCEVKYLPRTEGISSTKIRTEKRKIKIGIVGESNIAIKFINESKYVNGIEIVGIYSQNSDLLDRISGLYIANDYTDLINKIDALYIVSHPKKHYEQIKTALENGKHILCESPIVLTGKQCEELFEIAKNNECILMDAIKTAYLTSYQRMILMLKSGKIGDIVSIDTTCTSLSDIKNIDINNDWNSICAWGPTALLPIFQILGTQNLSSNIFSLFLDKEKKYDMFTKINIDYEKASTSVKVGNGIKSEGEMIISGTKGYVYVPAPWWKSEYFEIRFEDQNNNKKYYYNQEGEGIREEIVVFVRAIENNIDNSNITNDVSINICNIIEKIQK